MGNVECRRTRFRSDPEFADPTEGDVLPRGNIPGPLGNVLLIAISLKYVLRLKAEWEPEEQRQSQRKWSSRTLPLLRLLRALSPRQASTRVVYSLCGEKEM